MVRLAGGDWCWLLVLLLRMTLVCSRSALAPPRASLLLNKGAPAGHSRVRLSHSPLVHMKHLRGGEVYSVMDEDEDDEIDQELNGGSRVHDIMIPAFARDTWTSTPPVTRAFLSTSVLITVLSSVFNNDNFPQILEMNVLDVIQKLQIWRPFTAFLYFGPFGIGFLLTLQFMWTYMGQVEKLQYDHPEKFITMLLFGVVNMLLGFGLLGIPTQGLGHNLSSYFVYIWSRLFEGVEVNLMNIATVQAEMLPWIFCLQTLLLDQTFPVADLLGILIGHLYLYADGRKWEPLQKTTTAIGDLIGPNFKLLYSKYKRNYEF